MRNARHVWIAEGTLSGEAFDGNEEEAEITGVQLSYRPGDDGRQENLLTAQGGWGP
jgi:hypothetical protein